MLAIVFPGVHMQGKSKRTGNDYDFWSFPFVGRLKRFGQPDTFDADHFNLPSRPDVTLPCLCNLTFDTHGNLEEFTEISSDPLEFISFFEKEG